MFTIRPGLVAERPSRSTWDAEKESCRQCTALPSAFDATPPVSAPLLALIEDGWGVRRSSPAMWMEARVIRPQIQVTAAPYAVCTLEWEARMKWARCASSVSVQWPLL